MLSAQGLLLSNRSKSGLRLCGWGTLENAQREPLWFYSERGCNGSCLPPREEKPRRRDCLYVNAIASVAMDVCECSGLENPEKGYTEPY